MNRAAIVPYQGGRCGLVILDGDAAPYRVLVARTWDVGVLEPNPNAAAECDHAYLRTIEPRHLWALEEEVTAVLRAHHVASLVIESAPGSGKTAGWSRQIGDELACEAERHGLTVERRPRVAPDLSALAASLTPWPPVDDVSAVRGAAALLLGAGPTSAAARTIPLFAPSPAPVAPSRAPAITRPAPAPGRTVPPRLEQPGTVIIGFDLGSAHMGVAVAAGALPIDIVDALTLGVDPHDIDAVVAVAVELAIKAGATRAAIEHGVKFYVPDGASKQQIMSMAHAHAICGQLQRLLTDALEAAGIETQTWARQSWAHRVVQHHKGSVTTAAANDGVRAVCAPGSWERLGDQHQRDAAGVACMWLVEPPAPPKRCRPRARAAVDPDAPAPAPLTPEEKAAKQRGKWRERKRDHPAAGRPVDATAEERAALGCTCAAKHRADCPVYKARAASREPDERRVVSGEHPARACHVSASRR